MKILCTGDVHIGRRSSRLPPHLDGHAYSCGLAWTRLVDLAIADQVDLVCVTGDLIDQSNRYLEAIGTVENGLARLADADVTVLLVAGNHDHDVLPALVDAIGNPGVRLLGRGGEWERYTVIRGDRRLHVDGWSFPRAHHSTSPLRKYAPDHDGTPTVALLHADLEVRGSRYAPIGLSELRRHPEVFFLLGHVHAPRIVREAGGARYLYPGSPQAIDRGETGAHGAVILDHRGGEFVTREIPISTVRYEPLDISVEGIERMEELDVRVGAAVRAALDEIAAAADHLRCVRFRLRLTGPSRIGGELERRLAEVADDLELTAGEIVGSIESFWSQMSPVHDLRALAEGVGAPAVLARILGGAPLDGALGPQLRRLVNEIHGSRSFAEVSGDDEDLQTMEREAVEELQRAALLLLDELLLQKGVPT